MHADRSKERRVPAAALELAGALASPPGALSIAASPPASIDVSTSPHSLVSDTSTTNFRLFLEAQKYHSDSARDTLEVAELAAEALALLPKVATAAGALSPRTAAAA